MEESTITENRQNNASLNPYATGGQQLQPVNYSTGVQQVDALTQQGNQILQNSMDAQNRAVQQGVDTNVRELQRQRDLQTQEAEKQNKAFYQQYQKQVNPYGATQEALAGQGLAHSGIAETTKTNIYNTYQRSLTENMNSLRNVQADYDAKMSEVRANGDIALAQNLSNMYLQQLEQIRNAYSMAQAQKQFEWQQAVSDRDYNYQKSRDAIADQRYQQEFEYQKERDRIADEQWQKQYNLSASSRSGGGSSGRSSSRRSSGGGSSSSSNSLITSNPYGSTSGNPWQNLINASIQTATTTGSTLKKAGGSIANTIKGLFR
jgi:uncharacterized membrane protein YgcG